MTMPIPNRTIVIEAIPAAIATRIGARNGMTMRLVAVVAVGVVVLEMRKKRQLEGESLPR